MGETHGYVDQKDYKSSSWVYNKDNYPWNVLLQKKVALHWSEEEIWPQHDFLDLWTLSRA